MAKRLSFIILALFLALAAVARADGARVYIPMIGRGTGGTVRQWAQVVRVVDGDTVLVTLECCPCVERFRVRLVGVDTPERGDCFYSEATAATRRMVDGQRVILERDRSEWDGYGRLLRYVYTTRGDFVNGALVAQGYARVLTVAPNDRFAGMLRALQDQARGEGLGGWAVCGW